MLKVLAFLLPIGVWCAISYVPWIWHPQVMITERGGSSMYRVGNSPLREAFEQEQAKLEAEGKPLMAGARANPVFVPPPHAVAMALYTAFVTEPDRPRDPWLHQRIGQSVLILLKGFALAALIAVPLGVLCGTLDFFSKLVEPFVDFMRYMPAPAFGALMVAIFGLGDAPKTAIIFIGVFFNLLLVVANTARLMDNALLEAAQTLGAKRSKLFTHVVLPGSLPVIYNDLRIALGIAWVFLTVAEIIGSYSGITEFINMRGKRFNFADVYAGIIIIGLLGFITDQVLSFLDGVLFPWHGRSQKSWAAALMLRVRRDKGIPISGESLHGMRRAADAAGT